MLAKSLQSCLTLCEPVDCSPRLLCSRQAYWHGLPCSPPGIFLTQGLNLSLLCLLVWQADTGKPVKVADNIQNPYQTQVFQREGNRRTNCNPVHNSLSHVLYNEIIGNRKSLFSGNLYELFLSHKRVSSI